jgi:hypothetical protein
MQLHASDPPFSSHSLSRLREWPLLASSFLPSEDSSGLLYRHFRITSIVFSVLILSLCQMVPFTADLTEHWEGKSWICLRCVFVPFGQSLETKWFQP